MVLFKPFLVVLFATFSCKAASETVWPVPRSLTCEGSPIRLSSDFDIESSSESSLLATSIDRYKTLIKKQEISLSEPRSQERNSIEVVKVTTASDDESLNGDTSYEYWINVTADGQVSIKGASVYGAMYGMETFSQLVVNGSVECSTIEIHDVPTYRHRGLMIDTGRRFFTVPLVFSLLDAMSYVKMNVLHMHLSDFCRFSVESVLYPELTAGLKGQYYTQANISRIIEYARERGIRVMPEIDLPGHSKGLEPLSSHGLLEYCNSDHTEIYDDARNTSLYTLQNLLAEIAALFPEPLYHIGCDETAVIGDCSLQATQNLEKKLFNFTSHLMKTPVAFEEAFFETKSADHSVIIQTWEHYTAFDVVKQGVYAIENNKHNFYLSLEPLIDVKDVWTDIAVNMSSDQERSLLLGGEISYWTDNYCPVSQCQPQSTRPKPKAWWMYDTQHDDAFAQSVSNMIWPRSIAGAGSFWNYVSSLSSDDFLARYHAQNERLTERHVITCPTACVCDVLTKCGKPYSR